MFIINPYIYAVGRLLDNYTFENAFSIRLLKNSYSGALVRIRRSSDSAEKDFYPDSNDELSMSSEDGAGTSLSTWISTDSGYIVTWFNQGTGSDLTQSTAANQPRIVNAGSLETKGGKAAVYFDGSNYYVNRSALTTLQSYPFTILTVGSNESSGVNGLLAAQRNTSGDTSGINIQYDRSAAKGAFNLDEGATSNIFNYPAQINTADQRLQTFIITSGGNGELWKDGTSQESIASIGNFATTPTNNFEVGRQQLGSAYLTGYVQEVLVSSVDQTSDRTAIENDINENYDLYWNGQNTGILDDYPADNAYSLRNLDSSYTGALVRIRRSSDSAERDFYGTWNGEFPTTAVEDWVGAGNDGFITKIYDQAGSGDPLQATAANQPKIVSSGTVLTKNGKPAILFDGTDDYLYTSALSDTLNVYPYSFFAVGSNETSSDVGMFANIRESGSPNEGWQTALRRDIAGFAYYVDEGSTDDNLDYLALDNTNSQRLQTVTVTSGGVSELFLDGTSQDSATISECVPAVNTRLELGALQWASLYGNIYFQEFIHFRTDENSNRTGIETNINDHYSIY